MEFYRVNQFFGTKQQPRPFSRSMIFTITLSVFSSGQRRSFSLGIIQRRIYRSILRMTIRCRNKITQGCVAAKLEFEPEEVKQFRNSFMNRIIFQYIRHVVHAEATSPQRKRKCYGSARGFINGLWLWRRNCNAEGLLKHFSQEWPIFVLIRFCTMHGTPGYPAVLHGRKQRVFMSFKRRNLLTLE